MALQKQVVRMSAEGGLDTKTDSKNVLPMNLLELENYVYTKTNSWTKRFGYNALTKSILNSSEKIASGFAATTFKDELLRYSEDNLYSYAESENKWVRKGKANYALVDEFSVTANGDKLLNPSHYTLQNLTCYAYEYSGAAGVQGVECRIVDNTTGSVISTLSVDSNSVYPHVLGLGGTFFILYVNGGVVKYRKIKFSTPSDISSATSILTASDYNAEVIGDRIYAVAPDTTGLLVVYLDYNGTVSGPFSVADAEGSYDRLSISEEQTSSVRIVYGKSAGGKLKTVLYAADMNYQVHAPVQLASSATIYNIGAVESPSNPDASYLYMSFAGSAPYTISGILVTSAGSTTSLGNTFYQAALMSKPQVFNSKVHFVFCKNTSYLNGGPEYAPFRTYFLGNEDGTILAKYVENAGVFRQGGAELPNLNVEDDKLTFAVAEQAEVQANLASADVLVPTSVKKFIADFSTLNNYFDKTLGENLHIAGGILKMYDGDRVVEHNFLLAPETPQFVTDTGTGAVLPDGQYQYIVVYKWIDKAGQVHRSQTSLPLTYLVSSGPKKPTIRVFTLPFSMKEDVEIEIYRTEVNGTTFYKRAYNYADRISNDKTVESITFTDTMPDSELIQNEVLYTTGGVLDNASALSSKHITTYKSRVFLLSSDGYTIQYSKRREVNGPVEFSDELTITVDEHGGVGTVLATMDDYVIIFKKNAIYAFSGEGPNSLGEQGDFREPQFITSDTGCIDANSVVNTPNGLMFKSSKGIYILGRDMQTQYIGAQVEKYNDLTITSAELKAETSEVRFTTNSDRALVYDYFHKKWTTFTNINGVDSLIYNDKYMYLRANGDFMVETDDTFSDNGSYITGKISSSWIQLAGIQGFERFYKLLILGTYKSAHKLKVKFAYDFNPSWVQEATIVTGEVFDTSTSGSDAEFGDSSVFGGDFPLYQFRIFPKRQKCESFSFQIEDFKTDGNGESLSLSNFAAEVGLKPPAYKKSDSKSFAAS